MEDDGSAEVSLYSIASFLNYSSFTSPRFLYRRFRIAMSNPNLPYFFTILLILTSFHLCYSLHDSAGSSTVVLDSAEVLPHAMVLPLFISPPNDLSSLRKETRRRMRSGLLDSRTNAHMRLYDDLLLNGYYTTRVSIGTPPQVFALIVDSGSTATYVPCSTCDHCGKHQDPKFQPELSRTYEPVKCNMNCNCDANGDQCIYERHYAEMSSSSGVLGEDLISFGSQSQLEPQRAIFGCENSETGDIYSQHADGIMGLGRGELSIVDQLVEKGVISDSFSLCYGGMDFGGGAMVLGGIPPPKGTVFTHSDPVRSQYYNIELKDIHVSGTPLKLNPGVFDGRHGSVLDSGTTYAYLPEEAFSALKGSIIKKLGSLRKIQGPDPNYNDICFSGAGSDVEQLSKSFPTVDMVFNNGAKLTLSPENYLFRHLKVPGAYCFGFFQSGKDATTLLGGIVVRNTLVLYDRANERIGFWKTNCSELWERLHIHDAPPPPPTKTNSTLVVPPAEAPVESSRLNIPGDVHVGVITLEVSFNMDYSNLKPQVSELTSVIARELNFSTSQVILEEIVKGGKGSSRGRWRVYPERKGGLFSNETTVMIISRFSQHRIQIPKRFGAYRLVEWEVKSPSEIKRWNEDHRHVAVVVGLALILVAALVLVGVVVVARRRSQAVVAYKPVEEAVPEQELQPLSDLISSPNN